MDMTPVSKISSESPVIFKNIKESWEQNVHSGGIWIACCIGGAQLSAFMCLFFWVVWYIVLFVHAFLFPPCPCYPLWEKGTHLPFWSCSAQVTCFWQWNVSGCVGAEIFRVSVNVLKFALWFSAIHHKKDLSLVATSTKSREKVLIQSATWNLREPLRWAEP